jgi:DNA-binding CsgD family transcriptional regulator
VNPAAFPWRSTLAIALASSAPDEAAELAAIELERARGFGAPRALVIALRGAALASSGTAREALREGLDEAERCHAHALAARAREELRTAGARPRRGELRGRDVLTASETRVARMAATGMTNPEIAQTLFVTRRTVETHLTSAYRKLAVATRDQLPAALERTV